MAGGGVPTREELREHLVGSHIAGEVRTPRENNLANIGKLLDRHDNYTFGLELDRPWSYDDVLELLADRVGIVADPHYRAGIDTIDPDRTIDALDAMGDRLRKAAEAGARVLVATGHPTGVFAIHVRVAAALASAGCELLMPAEGYRYRRPVGGQHEIREVRYLAGVALVSDRGDLKHTHSPLPMRAVLADLAESGLPPPDLVVADHGWCGAAGQAGIEAVGFADCNDPALFVGEAEGKVAVAVPLDDNVRPLLYGPVSDYLLAGLAG